MDAYLAGLEQARDERPRPDHDPLGRVVLRLAGSTPRSTSASRRHRHRRGDGLRARPASPTPGWPTQVYEEVFDGDRWARARGRRRQAAAPAVGLDRRQEPRLPRHHVRRRPGRRGHRQHDARGDHRGGRRPRRDHGDRSRGDYDDAREVFDDLRAGHRLDDVIQVLEDEGVEKFEASWDELLDTVTAAAEGGRPSERSRRVSTAERRLRRRGRRHTRSAAKIASAGSPPRTPRSGARRPRPRPRTGSAGSTCTSPRGRCSPRSPRSRPSCAEGLDQVVLCGMGGSSLAPEVICPDRRRRARRARLHRPDFVARRAARTGSSKTVVVVSSKSGGDRRDRQPAARLREGVHRRGHRRRGADRRRHRPRLAAREVSARERLPRLPAPTRTSAAATRALTAFGLVPSGLAGADIAELLDEAEAAARARRPTSTDNPGLRLGAVLAGHAGAGQARARDRRRGHRRLRRLGRAAGRRVHRQGRHGHPAGRGRVRRAPPELAQRGARDLRPRAARATRRDQPACRRR